MYDLISIGHITIDLFFQGESFTHKDNRFQLAVGGKYVADALHIDIGGGGANVAIGASKNGLKTAVLGKIGNNSFKSFLLEDLKKDNVSTDLCQYEENFLNISCILLKKDGERTIIHYEPPHEGFISSEKDFPNLLDASFIYMANLSDISIEKRVELLKQAKINNKITILNLGVKDCRKPIEELKDLLDNTRILIANSHEWADLIKKQHESIDLKQNQLPNIDFFTDGILLITDGPNGSYGYRDNEIYYQEAISPQKILDTTGAGDGYTAGFIAEYFRTKDISASMKKGAEYATKILEQIGGN